MIDTQRQPIDYGSPVNRSHQLANGLVAWWLALPGFAGGAKFRDLMSPPDWSVGNNGTLTNMVPTPGSSGWQPSNRPGGFGTCLGFDGVDDYVIGPTNTTCQPSKGTVAIWANSSLNSGSKVIIGWNNLSTGLNGVTLYSSAGNISVDIGSGASDTVSTSGYTLVVGSWTHVGMTWDNVNVVFYINGTLFLSVANSRVPTNNVNPVTIGKDAGNLLRLWQGQLDDARIYNRALSAIEVGHLCQNSLAGYPGLLNHIRPWYMRPQVPILSHYMPLLPTFA